MTSHYSVPGDRQGRSASGSTSYDSWLYVVFPDGSVVWERPTAATEADDQSRLAVAPAPGAVPRLSAGLQGVVLGVAIALISAGFGAMLPWLVVAATTSVESCPEATSPEPGRLLNQRSPFLGAGQCHARR